MGTRPNGPFVDNLVDHTGCSLTDMLLALCVHGLWKIKKAYRDVGVKYGDKLKAVHMEYGICRRKKC